MSITHTHELSAGEPTGPMAEALAEVEAGQISYLTRDGQPVAALVSIDELAELQAAQDSADIAVAEAISSRPGPQIPHDVIEAMMNADDQAHDAMAAALDARKHEDIPPETVRAIWDAIMTSDNA